MKKIRNPEFVKTCYELVIDLLAAGIQEDDLGDKAFARLDVLIHNTAGSTGKSLSEALFLQNMWRRCCVQKLF